RLGQRAQSGAALGKFRSARVTVQDEQEGDLHVVVVGFRNVDEVRPDDAVVAERLFDRLAGRNYVNDRGIIPAAAGQKAEQEETGSKARAQGSPLDKSGVRVGAALKIRISARDKREGHAFLPSIEERFSSVFAGFGEHELACALEGGLGDAGAADQACDVGGTLRVFESTDDGLRAAVGDELADDEVHVAQGGDLREVGDRNDLV